MVELSSQLISRHACLPSPSTSYAIVECGGGETCSDMAWRDEPPFLNAHCPLRPERFRTWGIDLPRRHFCWESDRVSLRQSTSPFLRSCHRHCLLGNRRGGAVA